MKILYALQFHKGDQEAAMSLARLMADIQEERRCADADIMFAASANADFDHATMRYVGRRFSNVRTFRCVKDVNGWPAGPNNQAHETARYFAQQCMTGRWQYSGILLGEPDCVPLRRDVFKVLRDEWLKGPPTVLGPWVTAGPAPFNQHINGNSIFGPQFIYQHPQIFRCDEWLGWDAANCQFLMAHGRASLWMHSDYQLGTPQNPWKGCDYLWERAILRKPHPFWKIGTHEVAYLHGTKRWDLAQECVRYRLLGETITHHDNLAHVPKREVPGPDNPIPVPDRPAKKDDHPPSIGIPTAV